MPRKAAEEYQSWLPVALVPVLAPLLTRLRFGVTVRRMLRAG